MGTSAADRKQWVEDYWSRCDPNYGDGPGAESFAQLVARAARALRILKSYSAHEQAVVFSHGQPVRIQIPDETVGEEVQPYPHGMHTVSARSLMIDERGRLRLRYKMYLDQIQMNPSKLDLPQGALFEAS